MGENGSNGRVYSTGERLAKLESKVYGLCDIIKDLKDNHIGHLRSQVETLQTKMTEILVQTYARPHFVVTIIISTLCAIVGYLIAIIKLGA